MCSIRPYRHVEGRVVLADSLAYRHPCVRSMTLILMKCYSYHYCEWFSVRQTALITKAWESRCRFRDSTDFPFLAQNCTVFGRQTFPPKPYMHCSSVPIYATCSESLFLPYTITIKISGKAYCLGSASSLRYRRITTHIFH